MREQSVAVRQRLYTKAIGDLRKLNGLLAALNHHNLRWQADEIDVKMWSAVCPVCGFGQLGRHFYGLRIRESFYDGPCSLLCHQGCDPEDIRAVLACEPETLRVEEALDLAEGAADVAYRALAILGAVA